MELEGIAASIEIVWKSGEFIIKRCQSWRNADAEVDERINQIELIWIRTREQHKFLHRIRSRLQADHERILDDALGFLVQKYSQAERSLKKVLNNEDGQRPGIHGFGKRVRKGKYAFVKDTLDEVIKDMEDSLKRFDPTWYMILLMADSAIDDILKETKGPPGRALTEHQQLVKSVDAVYPGMAAKPTGLSRQSPLSLAQGVREARRVGKNRNTEGIMLGHQKMNGTSLPYCTAVVAKRRSSSRGTDQILIIDPITCAPGNSMETLEANVRSLAKRLVNSDPYTFGLLSCKGVMRRDETSSDEGFDMILRAPEGMINPTSLRHLLLDPNSQTTLSLTKRLHIAQQLARSVNYVHNFKFVHKGICPESVLLLSGDSTISIPKQQSYFAFLVGFGDFRAEDGNTSLFGDASWEKNLYRHPERQGSFLHESYRLKHDVYSLGVCLLEIGLWESFVEYVSEREVRKPKDSKSYREFRAWLNNHSETHESETRDQESDATGYHAMNTQHASFMLCQYLLHVAETRLPSCMGELYTDVVVSCLSPGGEAMANEEDDLGFEVQDDADELTAGVHYIEEILGKLTEISL